MMTNLTETAYYARKGIVYAILGIIAYIILRIVLSILLAIFLFIFPPKPAPPNHAFGKLPAVQFPNIASPSANFTFKLETIQGTVPRASESAAVYFMPKSSPNLLALTKTEDFAASFQFSPDPIQESRNIYRFDDPEIPGRILRYDIVSNNFMIRYAYETDSSLWVSKQINATSIGKTEAQKLLQEHGIMPEDFRNGPSVITYLKYSGGTLVETQSVVETDAVRVDLFRAQVRGLPVVSPYTKEGLISCIFSLSSDEKKHLLQLGYTYWPVDYKQVATYKLKTSTVAWTDLQEGRGYIPAYPTQGTVITVRKVYLAYYDTLEPQMYLQPIFVFEGDDGFVGYVPAISPEWTQ